MSVGTGRPLMRRARADADVDEAIDHYLAGSADVALGFVDALEVAYRAIRRTPSIGPPRNAHALNLPGLRFWPCRRYSYLIFYVEYADRIEAWRVLHASRDLPRWLVDDDPQGPR